MSKIDVSVVITVYNIENYVIRCLKSLVKERFVNIEILLIDDGSTDNSLFVCENFAKNYKNIKIFHQTNSGPSKARNLGLQNASGLYVCFFDGDDFIQENYINVLYTYMKRNDLDMLVANNFIYPKISKHKHKYVVNQVMDGWNIINYNNFIHSNNDLCGTWRMIFNKKFLLDNKLFFNEEIIYGEDFEFNLRAMLKSKRVLAIEDAGYYYVINRTDSLMRSHYKQEYENSILKQYLARKNNYGFNNYYDHDLYDYYLSNLFWKMIENQKASNSFNVNDIKRINNYQFFKDARKYFKLRYKSYSVKNYILYVLSILRFHHILYWILK